MRTGQAFRPVNLPVPVEVESEGGLPVATKLGGHMVCVASVEDCWVVEDEWWRDSPLARIYYEATLADGRRVTIFQDRLSGRWYRQHA